MLFALAACGANIGATMDASTGDTSTPDVGGDSGLGAWTAPVAIDIPPVGDDDPTATADLLELYFNRSGDIYVTTRASLTDAWLAPTVVTALSSTSGETTPEVSYDGLTFYLASSRPGTLGGNDIWISTRASRTAPWGTPINVPQLSSTAADGSPTTTNNLVMVLDTNRLTSGDVSLFIATRPAATSQWGTPAEIPNVNMTGATSGNPMLATNQLTLLFDSNRAGGGDLFMTTRGSIAGSFAAPYAITELNSAMAESDPWISQDGRTMYFTSNRDGTQRLWQTTR